MSYQGVGVLGPGLVSPQRVPGLRERIRERLRTVRAHRATDRSRSGPRPVPVVARGDVRWLLAEVARIEAAPPLVAHERFLVAAARAPEIPALLHEIGRLRELTFRAVGEGTGRAIDLDLHDRTYTHLFVWDRAARELAGAYRLAETEPLRAAFGSSGLYTHSLFDLREGFFERLGPAFELGRSFVRPEYQRSSQALLLLWKGVARTVAAHPTARRLFGAVSISADYSPESRALIACALSAHHGAPELAAYVRPRRPPRVGWRRRRRLAARIADARQGERLSQLVAEREPDGRELPVLVREYLKLGGRFVGWNVDPDFGDALDGLVVVDLTRTPRRLLEFYMGREGAAGFVARHPARSTGAATAGR